MIFAGVVACMCATIPETYAPAILLKRAKRLRAETGDPNITTEQELFRKTLKEIVIETAVRPFREYQPVYLRCTVKLTPTQR